MRDDLQARNDAILAATAVRQTAIRDQAWHDAAAEIGELADNPDLPGDAADREIYVAELRRIGEILHDGPAR